MRKTMKYVAFMFAITLIGMTTKANAQTINDNDLLEVASGINVNVQHTDLGNVDIKSAAVNDIYAKTALGKLSSVNAEKNGIEGLVTEGPEGLNEGKAEGPDLDGPGGSTHQFNGEETGQH